MGMIIGGQPVSWGGKKEDDWQVTWGKYQGVSVSNLPGPAYQEPYEGALLEYNRYSKEIEELNARLSGSTSRLSSLMNEQAMKPNTASERFLHDVTHMKPLSGTVPLEGGKYIVGGLESLTYEYSINTDGLVAASGGPLSGGTVGKDTGGYGRPKEQSMDLLNNPEMFLIARVQSEIDTTAREMESKLWRMEIINMAPFYMSDEFYDTRTAQDLLQYIAPAYGDLTLEDQQWLDDTWNKMLHLQNIFPEGYNGDILDAQDKILNQLLEGTRLQIRGLHNITVEEIAASFQGGLLPSFAPGMSEADVRNILSEMGMDDELMDTRQWVAERALDWRDEAIRMEEIRLGLVTAQVPDLSFGDFLKLGLVSPMMATMELLDKYWNMTVRPLAAYLNINLPSPVSYGITGLSLGIMGGAAAGATIGAFGGPIGMLGGAVIGGILGTVGGAIYGGFAGDADAKELEGLFNEARKQGLSDWSAYAQAFNDWSAPWYKKMAYECAFDPVNLIGWGAGVAIGKKLTTLAVPRGMRWLTSGVGNLLISTETAYIEATNVVFNIGKEAILAPIKTGFLLTGGGYQIPKTLTQASREWARYGVKKFKTVVDLAYPEIRGWRGLTAERLRVVGHGCIDRFIASPMEGGDRMVQAGAALIEFPYFDESTVTKIMKGHLDDLLIAQGMDTGDAYAFNKLFNEYLYRGDSPRQTAGKILTELGMSPDELAKPGVLDSFTDELTKLRDNIVTQAKARFNGEDPSKIVKSLYQDLYDTRHANLRSPITGHAEQAGRSFSWHSRVADRVLYSSQLVWLQNRVVLPIAKWNLLFVNFGPMNFFENIFRGASSGADTVVPRTYTERVTAQKLRGLTNDDWAYIMRDREATEQTIVHLQSLVNPKTGETDVFKGGKIPVVTKRLEVPSWLPDWMKGGKQIKFDVTIWGKTHSVGTMQDMYNLFGELTMRQARFHQDVMFEQSLANLYPEEYALYQNTVDSSKHLLDDISFLSGRDARETHEMLKGIGLGNPEYIRQQGELTVKQQEFRQILKDFRKVSDNMNEASPAVIGMIHEDIASGEMFLGGVDGIHRNFELARKLNRDTELVSLAPQIEILKSNTKEAIASSPRTLDELYGEIDNVAGMITAIDQRIHHYKELVALRKYNMKPQYRDEFESGSAALLDSYLGEAEKAINQQLDNLMWKVSGSPVDWTNVKFDKAIEEAGLVDTVKEIIDGLPTNVRFRVKRVQLGPEEQVINGRQVRAWYQHDTGTLHFAGVGSIQDDITYHELAHSHVGYMFEAGGSSSADAALVLSDFTRTLREYPELYERTVGVGTHDVSDESIRNIARVTDNNESYRAFKDIHEAHADLFSDWMRHPEAFRRTYPKLSSWFDQHYPTKAFDMSPAQIQSMKELSEIERQIAQDIVTTREELSVLRSEIAPFRKKNAKTMKTNPERGIREAEDFWRHQDAEAARIWNESRRRSIPLKRSEGLARLSLLDSIGKPVYVSNIGLDTSQGLTVDVLAKLSGTTGDDVYRTNVTILNQAIVTPRDDFIAHWQLMAQRYINQNPELAGRGMTVEKLGFTRDALNDLYDQMWRVQGFDPAKLTIDTPAMAQITEMENELIKLHDSVRISEVDAMKWKEYCNRVYNDIQALPMYQEQAGGHIPEGIRVMDKNGWLTAKEEALDAARVKHHQAYPTYGKDNIIDESMKAIFPFWNYEIFRWGWMPRTFMRQPGVLSNLARWMNYSDSGYVPIPGTDLQMNPLRGTIFMGGLRSLYLRDFPEFHDQVPGTEFIDYIGRLGFFPGIHVMAPIAIFGGVGGQAQMAELTPSWIRTGLSGLRELSPEFIGKILDRVYPDRFRDYQTMITLGSMGYDADDIWKKKKSGEALTPEEEKLWLEAERRVDGKVGILMQQTGLFRYRPPEFTQIRNEMRLAIEEATGVPVSIQQRIDELYPITGKRFNDYFHLDIQQQALLYSWEAYRRYQGVVTPLYPSSMQDLEIRMSEYYEELEKAYDDARYYGTWEDGEQTKLSITDLNKQFIDGVITPERWRSSRGDIQSGLSTFSQLLKNTDRYKDVPVTLEDRAERYAKLGIVMPAATPDQELMWMYFETQPQLEVNPDTGATEYNFEDYYAQLDIILDSLTPEYKQRFLDRVQRNWTPMERLYWETSRNYIAPYRQMTDIVKRQFSEEDQQILNEYLTASGTDRSNLRLAVGEDGTPVVAKYEDMLSTARRNLRVLSPQLDAWLCFWGYTDKLLTPTSAKMFEEYKTEYLVPEMVGSKSG